MKSRHFTAIYQSFSQWLNVLGYSAGMRSRNEGAIKCFFAWLKVQGYTHINQLNHAIIKRYVAYLETRPCKTKAGGLGTSHLNDSFAAIDKLLTFLHQNGSQHTPEPLNYRVLHDRMAQLDQIIPFTQQEIKTLQAQIPNSFENLEYELREKNQAHMKLAFILFYACGLRRSEGMKLRVKEVDFNRKTLFIRQGKNYKDRIVPMSPGVYDGLQDYVYNFRYLQKTTHDRLIMYTAQHLSGGLKTLQQMTKDPNIQNKQLSLHRLRHSIATHLLENGMKLENIAQFLGHSSLTSTQMYTHILNR